MAAKEETKFLFTPTKGVQKKDGQTLIGLANYIAKEIGAKPVDSAWLDSRGNGESACSICMEENDEKGRTARLCLEHGDARIYVYFLENGNGGLTRENSKSYTIVGDELFLGHGNMIPCVNNMV